MISALTFFQHNSQPETIFQSITLTVDTDCNAHLQRYIKHAVFKEQTGGDPPPIFFQWSGHSNSNLIRSAHTMFQVFAHSNQQGNTPIFEDICSEMVSNYSF